MQLVLEIKNRNELQLLIQYLKFLPSAKIVGKSDDKVLSTHTQNKPSFFDKYNGCIENNLSLTEIDARLHQLRQEWERDTW